MTINLPTSTTRKNLCTNPTFYVDTAGWSYTLGGAAISRVSGGGSAQVTWATAGAGAQAVGYALTGLTNGHTYTVSAYAYVGTGMPRVNIDAQGLAASGHSTVVGSYARLSVTFTASGSTATIRLVAYDAATAGQTAFITNVLIESGSTLGTYFDGYFANAWWEGSYGDSVSDMIVPAGLNPNQPVMGWHVWNLENPVPAGSSPTTVPLILGDRTRAFKVERGRQYELDQDQTGTASCSLVNNDGAVIGGRNNMYPARLGQFRVTYQGLTYVLFTGHVESWPDKASDPATSESVLTFSDVTDALANQPLPSMYQSQLQSLSPPPTFLWPLNEAASTSAATDVSGANGAPTYPIIAYKGGDPGSMKFGGASVCFNDGNTSLTNDNAAGPAGKASQLQFNGPNVPNGVGPVVDTTQPWMVIFVLKATAGKSSVFSILDKTGAPFATIWFDTSTWTVYWNIGGATFSWAAGQAYLGAGVNIGMGFDGTNAFYYESGATTTVAGYTPRGICSWVAAGASFSGTQIYNGSQSTYFMQYVALWSGGTIPPTGTNQGLVDLYYAFTIAYGNEILVGGPGGAQFDNTTQRMKRILGWAHQGGLAGDTYGVNAAPYYNSGFLQCLPDTKGAAPIDLLRQCALSVWGRFFIDKTGLPTFHSKDWNQGQFTPKYVFGGNTGAGELPYTGAPSFEYDMIHIYNDVQVSLPGSTLPSTYSNYLQKGALSRWVNSLSLGKYFTRVLQLTSHLEIATEALYLAQWLANRYGEPEYRIGDIVLDPISNPALWPAVLSLELDDVVQVNHRDLNGVRSAWYQVAKIIHEGQDGGFWHTTLSLTPFHQYWLLGAMHTTFKSSCLAGATSISINPLPDSATNSAEASLGVGTQITFEPGTPYAEAVTITSVISTPTPHAAGYTSITLGVTATAHAHAVGAVVCDQLPNGIVDPTTWDARSTLDSTTIVNA